MAANPAMQTRDPKNRGKNHSETTPSSPTKRVRKITPEGIRLALMTPRKEEPKIPEMTEERLRIREEIKDMGAEKDLERFERILTEPIREVA